MNPILAIAIPFLLLPSTALVFTLASRRLGSEKGYQLGIFFYWIIWCLLVPLLLLGRDGFSSLFADEAPLLSRPNWLAAVLWAFITLVTILMGGRLPTRIANPHPDCHLHRGASTALEILRQYPTRSSQ